jgi:hypothetical protein
MTLGERFWLFFSMFFLARATVVEPEQQIIYFVIAFIGGFCFYAVAGKNETKD